MASLALGSGSAFVFQVQNARGAAGTAYDTVQAGGALTLSAGTAVGSQITVSVSSVGTDGTSGSAANFDPTQNYQFVLVQANGGILGYTAGEFDVDSTGFANALDGGSFSVVENGNDLLLEFNAVPEPGTWALMLVGTGLPGLTRRCRCLRA